MKRLISQNGLLTGIKYGQLKSKINQEQLIPYLKLYQKVQYVFLIMEILLYSHQL